MYSEMPAHPDSSPAATVSAPARRPNEVSSAATSASQARKISAAAHAWLKNERE